MRRWLISSFIATYLGYMSWGIVSHAMQFLTFSHPVMYFCVWDMFCGWQAYETRFHLLAEGESGQLYLLSPPPWSEFAPFGDLTRTNYDVFGHSFHRVGQMTLKYTQHEPIQRILVVEECWQKKYNLPDDLWAMRFDEPKDPKSYFWLRSACSGDGKELFYGTHGFMHQCAELAVADNPRLKADTKRGRPVYVVDPQKRTRDASAPVPSNWTSAAPAPYTH